MTVEEQESLSQLQREVKACTLCPLRENATSPVCGIGELGSKYFLLGEAPGSNEDREGIPFVGLAGKRLDKLVELAGISKNDCYLTNLCKCKPPANRNPRKAEIRSCQGFLWREIRLVKPKIIITLGSVPLSLFSPNGVRQMHGTQFTFEMED